MKKNLIKFIKITLVMYLGVLTNQLGNILFITKSVDPATDLSGIFMFNLMGTIILSIPFFLIGFGISFFFKGNIFERKSLGIFAFLIGFLSVFIVENEFTIFPGENEVVTTFLTAIFFILLATVLYSLRGTLKSKI